VKKWGRRLGWLLFVAAVALALAWGYRPQPMTVEASPVTRGLMQVVVEEEGKTRVVDRFVVSAPVAGFAGRVNLEVGSQIRRGQTLVRLESLGSHAVDPRTKAQAQAQLTTAEAAVARAREEVEVAKTDARYWESLLPRRHELNEEGLISDEMLEQTESNSERATANLNTAQSAVKVAIAEHNAARVVLENTTAQERGKSGESVAVKAPVPGRVLKIFRESEGAVNSGEALLEIGNPTLLEVEVELLSADAVRTGPGTRVIFERWGGEHPLEGEVRSVEPFGFTKISALGVEEQRVRVIVDITSPREQWERLGDGYRVEAKFVLWEQSNVLQAPRSALFRKGEAWAAFVVDGQNAVLRTVQLGQQSGLVAQVTSGLAEGDLLITHPDDDIADGVEVQLREP